MGTEYFEIVYKQNIHLYNLNYIDADYVGDFKDEKLTIGFIFSLT